MAQAKNSLTLVVCINERPFNMSRRRNLMLQGGSKKMSQKSLTEEIQRLRRDSRHWLDQIAHAIKAIDEAPVEAEPGKDDKWPYLSRLR
jgi:hypothetical protein